jgi:excisionase family DNA binding protein
MNDRPKGPDMKKLVDSNTLAEQLGVTVETLNRLRDSGKIKGYKLIRQYRYDPEEVLAALKDDAT